MKRSRRGYRVTIDEKSHLDISACVTAPVYGFVVKRERSSGRVPRPRLLSSRMIREVFDKIVVREKWAERCFVVFLMNGKGESHRIRLARSRKRRWSRVFGKLRAELSWDDDEKIQSVRETKYSDVRRLQFSRISIPPRAIPPRSVALGRSWIRDTNSISEICRECVLSVSSLLIACRGNVVSQSRYDAHNTSSLRLLTSRQLPALNRFLEQTFLEEQKRHNICEISR